MITVKQSKKARMPKRLTECDKWRDPWFRKLAPEYKLVWLYLYENADVAGLIYYDPEMIEFQTKVSIDFAQFLTECGDRIQKLRNGKLWIKECIVIQNGTTLSPANNAHKGVIKGLINAGIDIKEHGFSVKNDNSTTNLGPHETLTRGTDKDTYTDNDKGKERRKEIASVWACYKSHHPNSRLSGKYRDHINARLAQGYTVEELKLAIEGNHRSPWHCGENPTKTLYHSLELITRVDKIDGFILQAKAAAKTNPSDQYKEAVDE